MTISPLHKHQNVSNGIHIPYAFEYADTAARTGATGFVASDVGKFARQTDNNTIWMLTGVGPSWIEISGGGVASSNKVVVSALKASAGNIYKGDAVYVVGYDTGTSSVTCELAQADDLLTMPAFGIAEANFTDSVAGNVLVSGALSGIDTSSFSEGSVLYVSTTTPGELTDTIPTNGYIQTVGVVAYSDAASGVINVLIQWLHDNQLGGSLHSEATTTVAGFMPATDKALLNADGEAAGKVLNSQGSGSPTWTENVAIRTVDFATGLGASTYLEGRLSYDDDNHTLRMYSDISDVSLQVGQESWVRVVNKTGSTISNGKVVYINGSFSDTPTIALAKADDISTVGAVVGLSTHDIANDAEGFVTTLGVVNDIDTSGFTNGDRLFVSPTSAGELTADSPIAPNLVSYIGVVTKSGVLGKIFVQTGIPTYSGDINRFKVSTSEPADYFTIKEAVDAAVAAGASNSNWWLIEVFPGSYTELPTTVPSGIMITNSNGERSGLIDIVASNPNENLYSMSGGTLSGLNLSGVTDSAKALVRIATPNTASSVLSCSVDSCSTGIFVGGGSVGIIRWLGVSVTFAGQEITNAVVAVDGSGTQAFVQQCFMSVPTAVLGGFSDNPIETAIKCTDQASVRAVANTFTIAAKNTDQSTIYVDDSAGALIQSSCFIDSNCCLRVGSTGTSTIVAMGNCLTNATTNFEILSATGTIFCQGSVDAIKPSIVAGGLLTGTLEDRSVQETVLIGNATYQYPNSGVGRRTEIGQFFHDGQSTGLTGGGAVTDGGGLTVDIAAGTGWVNRISPIDLAAVSWSGDSVLLTASQLNWVYYDGENEVLAASISEPGDTAIKLAQVATSGAGVRFIHAVYTTVDEVTRRMHDYLLSTRKFALNSGLALSQGTDATKIQVDAGSYYRTTELLSYVGSGGDATFSYFYGADGVTEITSQTALNLTQWDDSGSLTTMTDGYYRTDTAFLTSDGRISLILGDEEFETSDEAEVASVATPPTFIAESACKLANIVVLKASGIDSIVDVRPDPNAATAVSAGGGGGVTDHGLLSGLGDDDHTQYLLTAGSRAMSGSLNMGANNITNVGTVDGIDVTAHAARHAPGAADALTTAAPIAVTVGSAAAEGVAASLARSDHQHGVAAASPVAIGTANADGTSSSVARADHVHSHGSQTVGTLHAVTSSSGAGFQPQSNLSAVVAPTVNNDSSGGYTVGSRWIDTTTETEYVCMASTVGAAVWKITSSSTIATGSATEVSATADTNTASTTYTQMANMTSTPAAGTYLVTFSASGSNSAGTSDSTYAIHVGAAVVQRSERNIAWGGGNATNDFETALHSQAIVTVNGAEVIDVRYKVTTGTFTVHERNMILLRLA